MKYLLSLLAMLAWALWFGGTIAIFVFVSALFAQRRDIAGAAGQVLFPTLELWSIPVAAVGLLSVAIIVVSSPSRATKNIASMIFASFALATVVLVVSSLKVTPAIRDMFQRQLTHSAEFKKMHGISMLIHVIQAAALLVGGLLFPKLISLVLGCEKRQPEAAPVSNPPA